MFVQIGSEKIKVIKIIESKNGYMIRLSATDSPLFASELEKNDTFTIQDNETSRIISDYTVEYTVKWNNYVDYCISMEKSAVVITKGELDALNEQITNLELALCEMYESQEV